MTNHQDPNPDVYPWPTSGDEIIPDQSPVQADEFDGLSGFKTRFDERLAVSFLTAGNMLADQLRVTATDRDVDLIYPMLYCYRHYLELEMKRMIRVLAQISRDDIKIKLNRVHDLSTLWKEFLRHAVLVFPENDDANDTDALVQSIIEKFNEYDPDSQRFRYPATRDGKSAEGVAIDVEKTRACMVKLFSYFHGCGCYAAEIKEIDELNYEDCP